MGIIRDDYGNEVEDEYIVVSEYLDPFYYDGDKPCRPPNNDYYEPESWQQMNKGQLSKKQRRNK